MNQSGNTYITYDKLLSIVNDYFRMTGGEDFLSKGTLEMIVNLSIQDILNQSGYTYMVEFEVTKEKEKQGAYTVFTTKYPINVMYSVLIDGEGEPLELVNRLPEESSKQAYYKKGTNKIYVYGNVGYISVNYERAFEYQELGTETSRQKVIPLPFSYVPALVKMIYDNSSVFTFFQGDGVNTDFFGHSISRTNKLIEQDKISYNEKITIK